MSPHRRWWTASLQCKPARRECPNNPVSYAARLVEGIGAGSPVGEEQAEADSLKDTGYGTDGDGVSGPLLGENLGDNLKTVSVRFGNQDCKWHTDGAAEAKKIKEPR